MRKFLVFLVLCILFLGICCDAYFMIKTESAHKEIIERLDLIQSQVRGTEQSDSVEVHNAVDVRVNPIND